MRGAHDRTQVVGILDAIQQHQQPRLPQQVLQRGVTVCGGQGDHPLVRRRPRQAVQRRAILKSHGDGSLAGALDDLLKARAPSLEHRDSLYRASAFQRFEYGMDSGNGHGLHYTGVASLAPPARVAV